MTEKFINVRQRIINNLNDSQNAVERALVVLTDRELWKSPTHQQRGKYLADWVKNKKKLTGKFIKEARELVLQYVDELILPSLEKTRKTIVLLEAKIVQLKEWQKAVEEELNRLPFDNPPEKSIGEICREEGLY